MPVSRRAILPNAHVPLAPPKTPRRQFNKKIEGRFFVCLLCAHKTGFKQGLKPHHLKYHQHKKGDGKTNCQYCKQSWIEKGTSAYNHARECPKPLDQIRENWKMDEALKRFARIKLFDGEETAASFALCKQFPLIRPETPTIQPGSPSGQLYVAPLDLSTNHPVPTALNQIHQSPKIHVLTKAESEAVAKFIEALERHPTVALEDKAEAMSDGRYRCRVGTCQLITGGSKQARDHHRLHHQARAEFPCLLCRYNPRDPRRFIEHHEAFHVGNGSHKMRCGFCKVGFYPAKGGRPKTLHEQEHCPYNEEGHLRDGWVFSDEVKRATRTTFKADQDFRRSADLCTRYPPFLNDSSQHTSPNLLQVAGDQVSNAHDQLLAPQSPRQSSLQDLVNYSDGEPEESPAFNEFTSSSRAIQPEALSPDYNGHLSSGSRSHPYFRQHNSERNEHEAFYPFADPHAMLPSMEIDSEPESYRTHSLSKRRIHLTPRQAARYSDLLPVVSRLLLHRL